MEQIIANKYKIEIFEDWDKYENPRKATDYWNGFTFLLNSNNNFFPSNCSERLCDYVDGEDYEKDFRKLEREFGKGNVFTLSANIHGNVYLYLGKIKSDWDCGCLGFVILNPKESRKLGIRFSRKYTKEQHAEQFIKEWNRYLNEPEYAYRIYEKRSEDWEELESCYGYYSEEDCIADANSIVNKLI